VTNGRVFGYENISVNLPVERRINDTEAAVCYVVRAPSKPWRRKLLQDWKRQSEVYRP
jgi:hypothetical protein